MERLRGEGIEADGQISYREAIAAKLLVQSLLFDRSGAKAIDQLIALEPKEMHIEADTNVQSLNASVLARLDKRDLSELRRLRATIGRLASECVADD